MTGIPGHNRKKKTVNIAAKVCKHCGKKLDRERVICADGVFHAKCFKKHR